MNKDEINKFIEENDSRTITRILNKGKDYDKDIAEVKNDNSRLKKELYKDTRKTKLWIRSSIAVIMFLIVSCLVGCPRYKVYRSEMNGKAEYVQAEQNRRIQIETAKANLEASKLDADAAAIRAKGDKNVEIIRAEGMAEAMEIENGKLTPQYIQYLWVRNIAKGDKIYVPTEAGLPILEAKK